MLRTRQKYRFDIIGMTQDACGIGVLDGLKIFVDGVLPGERVEAELIKIGSDFAAARLLTLEHAVYNRVHPVCTCFGYCGGCSLQHIAYKDQLKLKRNMVCEALERIGGMDGSVVLETIGMGNPVLYRNKASYRVGRNDEGIVVGFSGVRSHKTIAIDECPIQHTISNKIKKAVQQYMMECGVSAYHPESGEGLIRHVVTRVGFSSGEAMAVIVINGGNLPHQENLIHLLCSRVPQLKSIYLNINKEHTNTVLSSECVFLHGKSSIVDYIGSLQFEISPLSFQQVNPTQTRVLYDKVLDYAGLAGKETVFDLYSGIGTISLYLANRADKVYGVESIEQAVVDAKKNALLNRIENAEFLVGRVETVLPELYRQGVKPDVVVVDPPRKGCNKRVLDTLVSMGPSRVVYVSCNPSTLARDVLRLQHHGYRLMEVQPVDMFPHTAHVECCVLMSRAG